MRIAFNTYSPALTDDKLISSATGLWFNQVVRHFVQLGHEVWNVSVGEEDDRADVVSRVFAKKVDLIILIWRWPMDPATYPQRALAYERQLELIDYALDHKIPVLIHDEDYKPGAEEAYDLLRRSDVPCTLSSPALHIVKPYKWLPFPLVHNRWMPSSNLSSKFFDFGYVGNNYERYEQMKTFFQHPPADWDSIHIYGNWMIDSPNRESPAQVKEDFPNVYFKNPVPQDQVLNTLAKYYFTAHFAKPEYCKHGFITMRWQEAVCAGTIAIVPDEFWLPTEIGHFFKDIDVTQLYNHTKYTTLLAKQYQCLRLLFDVDRWADLAMELVNQS